MARQDGRAPDQIRPVRITTGFQRFAEGSALIEVGDTHVLCAVSVEEGVPAFLRDRGQGWITAEYGMLPRSTLTRSPREAAAGRVSGRSQEIQRLIGRSLRAAVDMTLLGERTLRIDCDVLQADGGTRTAAITASYIALVLALRRLVSEGVVNTLPIRFAVAAVSAGIVDGQPLLDLCYEEDAHAEVDFNVVMTSTGEFVEVQGTAEGRPFGKNQMSQLLALSEKGIRELFLVQDHVLTLPNTR